MRRGSADWMNYVLVFSADDTYEDDDYELYRQDKDGEEKIEGKLVLRGAGYGDYIKFEPSSYELKDEEENITFNYFM
jgi:hypothetical protein